MVLMFIMYPMLCTNLLAVFQCREIDGLEWLEADLTIQCYTEVINSDILFVQLS